MVTSSPVERATWGGCFRVTCAPGADGRTVIRAQQVAAPFHLSKPYWTGDVLLVQAVNATAGVFAGDRLELAVDVEAGARVLLTSPSAQRIHTMPAGRADVRQEFRVAGGGWLEVFPELFIPQAGCRYRQATRVEVAEGGSLFFVETLAPGRVARGERFAFADVAWDFELRVAGRLVARERYDLRPGDDSTWSLRHPFPSGYYAGCYAVGPGAGDLAARQAEWHRPQDGLHVGASRIDEACWVIKVLASDSQRLRDALRDIRARLAEDRPALRADPRKL